MEYKYIIYLMSVVFIAQMLSVIVMDYSLIPYFTPTILRNTIIFGLIVGFFEFISNFKFFNQGVAQND